MKPQRILNSQNNLKKEEPGITYPDFKIYYKVKIIKKVWYCY